MAIKSLFLNQFSCVIYRFFQTFILYHMLKTDVSFPQNFKIATVPFHNSILYHMLKTDVSFPQNLK